MTISKDAFDCLGWFFSNVTSYAYNSYTGDFSIRPETDVYGNVHGVTIIAKHNDVEFGHHFYTLDRIQVMHRSNDTSELIFTLSNMSDDAAKSYYMKYGY